MARYSIIIQSKGICEERLSGLDSFIKSYASGNDSNVQWHMLLDEPKYKCEVTLPPLNDGSEWRIWDAIADFFKVLANEFPELSADAFFDYDPNKELLDQGLDDHGGFCVITLSSGSLRTDVIPII
jgi:hypothetical protein